MNCTATVPGMAALALLLAFVVVAIVLVRRQWTRRDKEWRIAVHHDAALEAAKLLKDWCSWLATISTAAIAANGFLAPKAVAASLCGPAAFSVLAIFSFLAAIVTTATLLLALPSVVARFKRQAVSGHNDFYEAQAFVWATTSVSRLTPLFRVGFIAACQYLFFVLGLVSFAIAAALRYAAP